ncbi:MAG TPA: plastocyanin/azurin family copper-binding protein [Thermoanaerobaculia bacterium]|nr:plastocyanin/azurin family copper-binding protein [Thermoanaerobaculia bacterium]
MMHNNELSSIAGRLLAVSLEQAEVAMERLVVLTRPILTAALFAAILGFAASAQEEGGATVKMTEARTYRPASVTIRVGERVSWTNTSELVHTVTAIAGLAGNRSHVQLPPDAEPFNSGRIQPGASYTHAFTVPGRYVYFCIPHEDDGMIGVVVVTDE